jgi:hypothetical protein
MRPPRRVPSVTLVTVGKWQVLAGASIAATAVPGDQFLALHDDRHAHVAALPFFTGDAFGLGQHLLAQATALLRGVHRKHAEIAVAVTPFDVAAGEQASCGFGQQHAAASAQDQSADIGRIGPLAIQQM